MKCFIWAFALSAVITASLSSQNGTGPSAPDLLGASLETVFEILGPPAELYPVRGEEAWQDDVVFYYAAHVYLFWFESRVWQIRYDHRYEGAVLGVTMGASREAVRGILGAPFWSEGDSAIYLLPDRGYPVRARLDFSNGVSIPAGSHAM